MLSRFIRNSCLLHNRRNSIIQHFSTQNNQDINSKTDELNKKIIICNASSIASSVAIAGFTCIGLIENIFFLSVVPAIGIINYIFYTRSAELKSQYLRIVENNNIKKD